MRITQLLCDFHDYTSCLTLIFGDNTSHQQIKNEQLYNPVTDKNSLWHGFKQLLAVFFDSLSQRAMLE